MPPVLRVLVLAIIFFFISNLKTCDCGIKRELKDEVETRIVGGTKRDIKDYPFMASIVIKTYATSRLFCAASITSRYWVTTAAHCVRHLKMYPKKNVFICTSNTKWIRGRCHGISRMIVHDNYADDNFLTDYDIAIIRVTRGFTGNLEHPVPVAGNNFDYNVNSTVTVIGWGLNSSESFEPQNDLHGVEVLLMDSFFCDTLYGRGIPQEVITPRMFCAGLYEGGKDACQADSGGPVLQQGVLVGVVSWGGICGNAEEPGVYARLSVFQAWIEAQEKKYGEEIVDVFKDSVYTYKA